jgi:hypothetical protein
MHNKIINKFIKQFKTKHHGDNIEIVGILGFGSRFSKKKLGANSDLDVYVVIENIGKRYRGIMIIDGVEVDYFVNPIEQLRLDWGRVKNNASTKKTAAYMLRDGKIILDHVGQLAKINSINLFFYFFKAVYVYQQAVSGQAHIQLFFFGI